MNKRALTLFVALTSSLLAGAQETINYFSSSDKIVREACTNACVIVEQTYQLKEKKTGNIYGLNGKDEFGSSISFGIATNDGLVVGVNAIRPWDYDPNYEPYKNDGKYEPVLYEISIKPVGEKEFSKWKSSEKASKEFGTKHSIVSCELPLGGLPLADTSGKVDGWMIWTMYHVMDELAKETEYKIMTNYYMDVEVGNEAFEVAPPKSNYRAIGGFLVVPHITKIGSVTFELCGVARKEGDKWLLSPTPKQKKVESEQDNPKEPEQVGEEEETPKPTGRLTRVRKGKKGNN